MFSWSVFQVRNSLIAQQMASFQVILGVNMGREHPEKPVVNFKPDIQGVTIDLSFANPKFVLVQPRWQDELYLEIFPLGYLLEIVDNKLMKTLDPSLFTDRCLPPGAKYTVPISIDSLCSASLTFIRDILFNRLANDAVNVSGICWAMIIGDGIVGGIAGIIFWRAIGPPVEHPIAIIFIGCDNLFVYLLINLLPLS